MHPISREYLQSVLRYEDGKLFWRSDTNRSPQWNRKYAGTLAGNVSTGYRRITFQPNSINRLKKKKSVLVHRAIFLMHHGYLPEYLDHINGKTTENSIENLRPATLCQNSVNAKTPKNNTTGQKGVAPRGAGKFQARLSFNKKRYTLGTFDSFDEAVQVYKDAEIRILGEWRYGVTNLQKMQIAPGV